MPDCSVYSVIVLFRAQLKHEFECQRRGKAEKIHLHCIRMLNIYNMTAYVFLISYVSSPWIEPNSDRSCLPSEGPSCVQLWEGRVGAPRNQNCFSRLPFTPQSETLLLWDRVRCAHQATLFSSLGMWQLAVRAPGKERREKKSRQRKHETRTLNFLFC